MLEDCCRAGGQALRARPARVRGDRLRHHHHLSAADATEHIIHNPFVPTCLNHQLGVTLLLLALLGAIFIKGFKEAIGLAVGSSSSTCAERRGLGWALLTSPAIPSTCRAGRKAAPRLPQQPADDRSRRCSSFPSSRWACRASRPASRSCRWSRAIPATTRAPGGRIRNTRTLLRTAALIMSVMLIGSSLRRRCSIPAEACGRAGRRRARALLSRARALGEIFGTVYDMSTIAILWFAGASAMAGLLNLVPRYLPRYGMAPEWTKATRPLVLLFTAITFVITIIFDADVEAREAPTRPGCWC
jgi:hypothetical protein